MAEHATSGSDSGDMDAHRAAYHNFIEGSIAVQAGAGAGANISDDAFATAGAKIVKDGFADADIVLTVRRPSEGLAKSLKKGAVLAGGLDPYGDRAGLEALAKTGLTLFAMELMP